MYYKRQDFDDNYFYYSKKVINYLTIFYKFTKFTIGITVIFYFA